MTQEITYGQLVDRIIKRAEDYDCQNNRCPFSSVKGYSFAGRKIQYLEVTSVLGGVTGMLGVGGIIAGIFSCVVLWYFPSSVAAAAWGGTSAGLIIVGFGIEAISSHLSKKERRKTVTSDQIKSILEREKAYNKHPQVLSNITALLDEYEIELEAPSQHTPAKLWKKDAEVGGITESCV